MMSRFESESRVMKPAGFDRWLSECGDVADVLGAWALIGVWFSSAPDRICGRGIASAGNF